MPFKHLLNVQTTESFDIHMPFGDAYEYLLKKPLEIGYSTDSTFIHLVMDFLIDEQISSFCSDQPWAGLLTLIMLLKLTQSL